MGSRRIFRSNEEDIEHIRSHACGLPAGIRVSAVGQLGGSNGWKTRHAICVIPAALPNESGSKLAEILQLHQAAVEYSGRGITPGMPQHLNPGYSLWSLKKTDRKHRGKGVKILVHGQDQQVVALGICAD